ncbi:hypothetical protein B0H19DRAFT_1080546 [Mycena capillaripes]|nr:hypothetical protein B0H19DRAFT_1080546 [Mycena capillaripes]
MCYRELSLLVTESSIYGIVVGSLDSPTTKNWTSIPRAPSSVLETPAARMGPVQGAPPALYSLFHSQQLRPERNHASYSYPASHWDTKPLPYHTVREMEASPMRVRGQVSSCTARASRRTCATHRDAISPSPINHESPPNIPISFAGMYGKRRAPASASVVGVLGGARTFILKRRQLRKEEGGRKPCRATGRWRGVRRGGGRSERKKEAGG